MPCAPGRGRGGAGAHPPPAGPPRHGEDGRVCVQGAVLELGHAVGRWQAYLGCPQWQAVVGGGTVTPWVGLFVAEGEVNQFKADWLNVQWLLFQALFQIYSTRGFLAVLC